MRISEDWKLINVRGWDENLYSLKARNPAIGDSTANVLNIRKTPVANAFLRLQGGKGMNLRGREVS